MLRKNEIFEMDCTSFGSDAMGVCRHEGMAVFVPRLLPGERALVRVVKTEKRYAYGRVEKLLEASPERTEPFCPIYGRCGGCVCQHMRYETSLAFKRDQVRELLRRVGGIQVSVPPVLGMKDPRAYRNKGVYPVGVVGGKPACGFFAPRSHDLIPLPETGCAIQREDSQRALEAVLSWMREVGATVYDERSGRGLVRHVMTRSTTSGALMLVLVATDTLPAQGRLIAHLQARAPGLGSVYLCVNAKPGNVILGGDMRLLWGAAELEQTLCGLRFGISPLSFFQVNPVQTQKLYELALAFANLTGGETVVDAYCGAGTITLLLARHARQVVGIEIVPEAIADARKNAQKNGIHNARFIQGATEKVLPELAGAGLTPDVIVLDPPRKGCDDAVLRSIIDVGVKRVVYISCSAPSLARDARTLLEGGYGLDKLQCVDMFCYTGAVETVVSLSQQKPDDVIREGLDLDELEVTPAEAKATYGEIKA